MADMIDCTHMFAHQVGDLHRAVQRSITSHTSNAMVRMGEETRNQIAETLRTRGPMTVADIARAMDRTRACVNDHLLRMTTENPLRVRRQSEKYNAKWETV